MDLYWSSNRVNRFINSSSHFSSPDLATRYDQLIKNADGSYTLTRQDQSVYRFNATGRLLEQSNGHGQSFTLTYDATGRPEKITEPVSGQFLTLQYNADGLLERVADPLNRQVLFNYDANHHLTGIVNPKGQATTYTYNEKGQALTATDPEGIQLFSNTYDEKGSIITQDDAIEENQSSSFSYDETSQPGKIITTVTDRIGRSRVITHNSNYQVLNIKDESGTLLTNTYDLSGNKTSVADACYTTTIFTYDKKGNLLTSTDAKGRSEPVDLSH